MVTRTIRENEELKESINEKVDRIIVKGQLAEHLNTAMKIKKVSKWTVGLLAASLAATPLTGALSIALFAPNWPITTRITSTKFIKKNTNTTSGTCKTYSQTGI